MLRRNWKLKATVFRILSHMPFGSHMHFLLQKRVTKEWPRPTVVLDELLVAAKRVYLASEGCNGHFLEIGAGRDLAVAVALRLLGAKQVTCVDVSRLARPELIAHAAVHLADRLGVDAPAIKDWHDVERFGIFYRAPVHLQNAGIPASSVDCFFSIDTFEHIPPKQLRTVLIEAKHVLKPGGLSIHCIDYGDHYARGEDGFSRFNFLTYTERNWRPFNSPLQYVNRWRHSQFLQLFEEVGMKLVHEVPDFLPPEHAILKSLAPEFRGFDVADLFTIRAFIVSSAGTDH